MSDLSSKIVEYARTKNSANSMVGLEYSYAFGFVFAFLTEEQRNEIEEIIDSKGETK